MKRDTIKLLAFLLLLSGTTACVNDPVADFPAPRASGEESHVYVNVATRAASGSVASINTDNVDFEDYVSALRVIAADPASGEVRYNGTPVMNGNRLTFKIRAGVYDLYFIANESVPGVHDLSAALNGITSVEQLYSAAALMKVPYRRDLGRVNKSTFRMLMHACYKGVTLSGNGSLTNPTPVVLPSASGKVELLRALAKVEITLKEVVEKRGATYAWIGPLGFGSVRNIYMKNIPSTYSMLPLDIYFDGQLLPEVVPQGDQYTLPAQPAAADVLPYTGSLPEESVGGILPLDYRFTFYIPEYFIGAVNAPYYPKLTVSWSKEVGSDILTKDYDIENGSDDPTYYKAEYPNISPGRNSIYRNRLYRITATPRAIP